MHWLSRNFLLTISGAVAVHAATVTKDWTLAAEPISPDGFTRSATLVNGGFPGPLLTANKGDSITVNVHSNLADPTMRRSTSIVRLSSLMLSDSRELISASIIALAWIREFSHYFQLAYTEH